MAGGPAAARPRLGLCRWRREWAAAGRSGRSADRADGRAGRRRAGPVAHHAGAPQSGARRRGRHGAAGQRPDRRGVRAASRPLPGAGRAADARRGRRAAPRELERAVRELGLKGALLCGRTRERHLDHPDFRPLLARAAALGVPLFIHPQTPLAEVRRANYSGIGETADLALAAFGLGWHYEAGLQWIRLAAAGVFDALPDLQIILGHWGEVVLFYLERTAAVFERALTLQRPLADYARRNLYVTGSGMWSEAYLQRCLEIVGPERLLFSTDFPYQYRPGGAPRRFLDTVPLDEAARRGLAHGNWERLTGAVG
ncbi:amidohydrolase family protein [Sphingomonas sp. SORGH_AS_0950]|uniref:amidohydrolase family protein n=1 Tax=Sphingomonas sp. SORGH_AS_0950 TaxID=3041792 RepID=UPI00358E2FB7